MRFSITEFLVMRLYVETSNRSPSAEKGLYFGPLPLLFLVSGSHRENDNGREGGSESLFRLGLIIHRAFFRTSFTLLLSRIHLLLLPRRT